jgi:hypothetical protein
VRWAAPVLLALVLTGCETTAEKSGKLERDAKLHELHAAVQPGVPGARGLSITRASTKVRVTASSVLHSSEGTAAVVTLRNLSATPLRGVPIAITVRDARGASLYTNGAPGLGASLTSAPLLPAHGTLTWVDDQIQAAGAPASVLVKVGEAPSATGAIPTLGVAGARLFEDPSNGPGAEGSIVNHSRVDQQELVVYALARRAGRVVAAGRAILPRAPAGASTRFQLFFIGEPRGARLEVSAPATTLG